MELPLFCMQQRTGSGGGRKKMMSPGFSFPHDLYLCGGAGTPSSLQNPKARRHSETTEETSALRLLAAASIAVAQVERRQWWKPLLHRCLLQLRKAVMPLAAAFLREISFRCLHDLDAAPHMGEAASHADYDRVSAAAGDGGDDGRVHEWELGLPGGDDLVLLSQSLIPPELASAFRINPEPARTLLDVHRASQHTISNLRRINPSPAAAAALRSFHPFPSPAGEDDDPMAFEADEPSPKARRVDSAAAAEEAESSAPPPENSNDDHSARTLKRPRLVWTPQLHKRFVDVVAHLGIKNAVPKTIMQLMNVEGLTRENVASHLQKYRLYLKRMQGLSNEGPSSSDHLFASTPVPQSLREQQLPVPMPYAVPTMIPMPAYGMPHPHNGLGSPMGMVPVSNHQVGGGAFYGFEAHHYPYGAFGERQKDW
ncbi:hypothetical protein BHE74_00026564 [Ensete ventricosum]|nr:hypothetical protein BHE74_00026564 [Ensete ventricosum]